MPNNTCTNCTAIFFAKQVRRTCDACLRNPWKLRKLPPLVTYKTPHSPPFPIANHEDEQWVQKECPGIVTADVFLVVPGPPIPDSGHHTDDDVTDYNCFGWAEFNGPSCKRTEPDSQDMDTLEAAKELLLGVGWVTCHPDRATCVVVGPDAFNLAHVMIVWRPKTEADRLWAEQNQGPWWESKMGFMGPRVLHRRDAMAHDPSYGNELGWFKRMED